MTDYADGLYFSVLRVSIDYENGFSSTTVITCSYSLNETPLRIIQQKKSEGGEISLSLSSFSSMSRLSLKKTNVMS